MWSAETFVISKQQWKMVKRWTLEPITVKSVKLMNITALTKKKTTKKNTDTRTNLLSLHACLHACNKMNYCQSMCVQVCGKKRGEYFGLKFYLVFYVHGKAVLKYISLSVGHALKHWRVWTICINTGRCRSFPWGSKGETQIEWCCDSFL